MARRLASLIRRARRLASERERLVDSLAREWTTALRGQGLSAQDLDEFWAGLTEEAVRRLQRAPDGRWPAEAVRREAALVIGAVRERVSHAIRKG